MPLCLHMLLMLGMRASAFSPSFMIADAAAKMQCYAIAAGHFDKAIQRMTDKLLRTTIVSFNTFRQVPLHPYANYLVLI